MNCPFGFCFAALAAVACALTGCGLQAPPADVLTVQVGQLQLANAAMASALGETGGKPVIRSYGRLSIGQSREDARAILGTPERTVLLEDEREAYADAGHVPDDELVFILGFDSADEFGLARDPALPVFKVFYQADRVVYFKMSLYVLEPRRETEEPSRIGFPPSCFLFAPANDVEATFGPAEFAEPADANGNVTMHYFRRGLSVILEDDRVVAFDVYGELNPSTEETFRLRTEESDDAEPAMP